MVLGVDFKPSLSRPLRLVFAFTKLCWVCCRTSNEYSNSVRVKNLLLKILGRMELLALRSPVNFDPDHTVGLFSIWKSKQLRQSSLGKNVRSLLFVNHHIRSAQVWHVFLILSRDKNNVSHTTFWNYRCEMLDTIAQLFYSSDGKRLRTILAEVNFANPYTSWGWCAGGWVGVKAR